MARFFYDSDFCTEGRLLGNSQRCPLVSVIQHTTEAEASRDMDSTLSNGNSIKLEKLNYAKTHWMKQKGIWCCGAMG